MTKWNENRYDTPSKVHLLGDYYAVLSCKEVNEWTEYLWERPEYVKFNANLFSIESIKIAYQGSQNESDVFESITEVELDQLELLKKLHNIAHKWYTNVILSRDKKNDSD